MKNLFSISLLCLIFFGRAQNNNSWHFGLQFGFHGNNSTFSGGMENANARFENLEYGGGAFSLMTRYDLDKHWMFTAGFGLSTFGFEYDLANNYSLLSDEGHYSVLQSEFTCLEIPTMIHYKFNPNCKNSKWVIGAGFVQSIIGTQNSQDAYTSSNEGSMNAENMTCSSATNANLNYALRFSFARERLLKRGNIIGVSLVVNLGLNEIATSHVEYELESKKYAHDFSNKGSYFGFKVDYYLRNWKSN